MRYGEDSALKVTLKCIGGLVLLAVILVVLAAIAYCIIRWAIPGGEEWIQPVTDWLNNLFGTTTVPPPDEGVVETTNIIN